MRASSELHELAELYGGRFIASASQHGVGKGSGLETTMPTLAIAFRDNQIAQLEFLARPEDALTAHGQAG